ncbi:MAG: hypothetical protein Q9160_002249 [Pyrenula sp. 1 TL-2023]
MEPRTLSDRFELDNIRQVAQFPRKGKKDRRGNWSRTKQTSYRCQEIPNYNKCAKAPNQFGKWTGPYVSIPQDTFFQVLLIPGRTGLHILQSPVPILKVRWAVVFCPRFFKDGRSRYINEITGGNKKQASEIGFLISFEYIVIHEWMHNKLFGYKFMSKSNHRLNRPVLLMLIIRLVEDVKGNIPGQPDGQTIYGDSLCHEYAWLNMGGRIPGGGVNIYTAWNADNYAWFFNYNWYWYQWQWKDDGSHSFKRSLAERDDDPITFDSSEGDVSEKDLDMSQDTVPINVHVEGKDQNGLAMATFDYVGEDYGDFINDSKQAFTAPNSDCILS